MDRFLHAMSVFAYVARLGTFTAAADALGVATGSVSTTIRQLESYLNVTLLQRSTRAMRLTAEGAQYYEHCIGVLGEIEAMTQTMRNTENVARGRLCVDIDREVASVLLPSISEFRTAYPDVQLKIAIGGDADGLIDNGVDCAVVVGNLSDSSLKSRHLGVFQSVTVASRDYLSRHGIPSEPESLQEHVVVHYIPKRFGNARHLRFRAEGEDVVVKMPERVCVNDAAAVLQCVIDGTGVAQVCYLMALPHLRSGRLKEVLAHRRPSPLPISGVYANHRRAPMAQRAFMDWAADKLEAHRRRSETIHVPLISEAPLRACHIVPTECPTYLSAFVVAVGEAAA
ncbi:LysR family transcriptional regulator [Paraburkholderia youngii]|uniref:LysR family transcriptional regulator n=1 Tax=Paraburkholderia youngii TaxID=2782701 RepID=A0A7Y6JZ65_9BURK|nr:LysR family transcriptional regulator [Paraburkholderia youngii]NUY01447.1 LysR family transcriptional regulator [Paraburkholderia youngii]